MSIFQFLINPPNIVACNGILSSDKFLLGYFKWGTGAHPTDHERVNTVEFNCRRCFLYFFLCKSVIINISTTTAVVIIVINPPYRLIYLNLKEQKRISNKEGKTKILRRIHCIELIRNKIPIVYRHRIIIKYWTLVNVIGCFRSKAHLLIYESLIL